MDKLDDPDRVAASRRALARLLDLLARTVVNQLTQEKTQAVAAPCSPEAPPASAFETKTQ